MAKRKYKKRKKRVKKTINKAYLFSGALILIALVVIVLNFEKIVSIRKDLHNSKLKIKQISQEKTVLDAIIHAKNLLGVSDKYFSHFVGDNTIYIKMGIDRRDLDLNYANMILSGQIELENGEMLSGVEKENGEKQILKILDKDDGQNYQVTLYYRKNTVQEKKKTQLAIVVDDFGIHNNTLLDKFCSLDKNVTFAILPDQRYSELVMTKAVESGHETLIHIPMEPISYPQNNPGKNAIFVHLSEREIKKRMEHFVKQLPLCIGANNHMGSLVTTDEKVMKIVLSVLKEHNLFFIDSRTSTSSIAYDLAKRMIMPAFEASLFLDTPDISQETMKSKIKILKSMAKTHDKILVITHCATQERYEYLRQFLDRISHLDFELIPVSVLFKNDLPKIL